MSENARRLARRRFLKTTIKASTLLIAPQVIAATALGRDGAVAPSERIVMGGIGIGNRGTYDLGCFLEQPDAQYVAIVGHEFELCLRRGAEELRPFTPDAPRSRHGAFGLRRRQRMGPNHRVDRRRLAEFEEGMPGSAEALRFTVEPCVDALPGGQRLGQEVQHPAIVRR